MEKNVLNANRRTVIGRKVKSLRREGKLPAVMYGSNFEPTPILLDFHEASMVLRGASSSTIIYVNLDGKECASLVQDKQRNYIRGELLHVDFRVVDMNVVINANVPLTMVGEAPAIRVLGGFLMVDTSVIEVEALPGDLPEHIEVDVNVLVDYDSRILAGDLKLPKGVALLTDPETLIALVSPLADEAEEGAAEGAGIAEPKVIEKGKIAEPESD